MDSDLADRDALGWAAAVRAGEVSPRELVDAAISRLEQLDPVLGILVSERFERARSEAAGRLPDGPFRGVPFLLKDAVQHSAGDRYQHGMRLLRDHPFVSPADTELTARYRRLGLVVLGRTAVPELTVATTTEPLAHPPVRNPWDLRRSAGGSSGGSAAAVAAGIVPAAHGNDMGGSIRIPASCCGLVGLKPSRDRITAGPLHGDYWGPLTCEHVLTRSVRDSAAFLDGTAGPLPGDLHAAPPPARPWLLAASTEPPRLRIGLVLNRPDGGAVDPACAGAAAALARVLERLGHVVEPFPGSRLADDAGQAALFTVLAVSVARDVRHWERVTGAVADLEPFPALLLATGTATPAADYVDALDALAGWSRRIAQATAAVDVLLTPTMAVPAPPLDRLSPRQPLDDVLIGSYDMSSFALPFNVSGQPAISLPTGSSEVVPVGAQLVGPYAGEDLLLSLAGQVEQAVPWWERRPVLTASLPQPPPTAGPISAIF